MKALREFKCILPPMELQNQFVDTYKQSDKSKFELNEAIKELDAMYKRIIKDNLG
jgi:type I restriction enzyme S subunit